MNKSLNIVLAGIFAASSLSLAYAEHPHQEGKWKEHKEAMFKDLGLSEEEQKQMESHKKQKHEDMKKFQEQIEDKHKALRNELDKEEVDMAKVNQIQADLKNLHSQKVDQKIKHMVEMRQTLGAEKYKKLSEKMEGMKGKWKEHKDKHPRSMHEKDQD